MAEVEASDGVRLYAEAHGEGIPVVFSCPLNTTRENWRPQVGPLMAAGFRVVLWDYRGHGRSGAPEAPEAYSMEQVVDDLGRVLDALAPGEPAVLAGLSFGGLASLHFTLRHPERVRALLLIDSGPGFKNPKAQARWQASCEKTSSFIEARGMAEFASRATELTVGRDLELPAARAAQAAIAEQSAHGLAEFGRRIAGPAPPVIDQLQQIEQPALVIVGEKDEAYLRAAEVMAAKLPNVESVTLAGAAHVVNIEAADAFNAAALAFLERVRAGGARAD
jgi:pimeloyl-ACP methyl ester carboxylesterase